jgi:hypothetical protein
MKKLLYLALVLCVTSAAYAATWDGTTSTDYWDSTNWVSDTMPTSTTQAQFPAITAPDDDCHISYGSDIIKKLAVNGGTLYMDGGHIYASGSQAYVGRTAVGTLNLSDGLLDTGGASLFILDQNFHSSGNVLNQTGGTIFTNQMFICNWTAQVGDGATFNMYGGGFYTPNVYLYDENNPVNNKGAGRWNMYGGKMVLTYTGGTGESWSVYKGRLMGYNIGGSPVWSVDDTNQILTLTPEPATIALLGLGGLVLLRKKR